MKFRLNVNTLYFKRRTDFSECHAHSREVGSRILVKSRRSYTFTRTELTEIKFPILMGLYL